MSYIFPAVLSLFWVAVCLGLLLMPTQNSHVAIIAVGLLALHKDASRNLEGKVEPNEFDIVGAIAALAVMAIAFCFILYVLFNHYVLA